MTPDQTFEVVEKLFDNGVLNEICKINSVILTFAITTSCLLFFIVGLLVGLWSTAGRDLYYWAYDKIKSKIKSRKKRKAESAEGE